MIETPAQKDVVKEAKERKEKMAKGEETDVEVVEKKEGSTEYEEEEPQQSLPSGIFTLSLVLKRHYESDVRLWRCATAKYDINVI